jgi:hypothetical protein
VRIRHASADKAADPTPARSRSANLPAEHEARYYQQAAVV